MRNGIWGLLFWGMFAAPAIGQSSSTWTLKDFLQVKRVSTLSVSPEGNEVAFTVQETVTDPMGYTYRSQVWLADRRTNQVRPLTFAQAAATQPAWIPGKRAISFVSGRSANTTSLFALSLSGGEAQPVLSLTVGIQAYAWSPNGQQVALLLADVQPKPQGRDDMYDHGTQDVPHRLWIATRQEDGQLVLGAHAISPKDRHITDMAWAPDGKRIAVSHQASSSANNWVTADLAWVEVATAQWESLIESPAALSQPVFSPDGQTLAYLSSEETPVWGGELRVALYHIKEKKAQWLPLTADGGGRYTRLLGFTKDGRQLLYTEQAGTYSQVAGFTLPSGQIRVLGTRTDQFYQAIDFQPACQCMAMAAESTGKPAGIFHTPLQPFAPSEIGQLQAGQAGKPFGKTEIVAWKSKDGLPIEGLLVYPADYTPGKQYPLLMSIHGGPMGVHRQTYTGAIDPSSGPYPLAIFSQRGYFVFRPNPRGSSGYGSAFRKGNHRDWGGLDFQDCLTGIDHLVGMGMVDTTRLGIMGWSYGGYLSAWATGQTKLFKAASIGAPVINLLSFTGTTDIPGFIPSYFGGEFWEEPDLYKERSPIHFAHKITVPCLIQHCEGDIRVPLGQALELYQALQRNEIPVRLQVMPRQGHLPLEPMAWLRFMEANLEWFDTWLK